MAKSMKVVESKKAAMKKMVKSQSLKKEVPKSAAMKKSGKHCAAENVPLTKGAKAVKTKQGKKSDGFTLEKGKLKQLGSLSLQERVERACETAETPEAAASRLRDTMTKGDKSNVWSQHQNYLRTHPEEKEEYDQMSNLEKGRCQSL
jgi:hypothetical protein